MPGPKPAARGVGLACFVSAVVIAVGFAGFAGYFHRAFEVDKANFALFAAFYGVIQGVERLLEIVSQFVPPWGDTDQDKSDRAIEMLGIATVAGVGASMVSVPSFLPAIAATSGHS